MNDLEILAIRTSDVVVNGQAGKLSVGAVMTG